MRRKETNFVGREISKQTETAGVPFKNTTSKDEYIAILEAEILNLKRQSEKELAYGSALPSQHTGHTVDQNEVLQVRSHLPVGKHIFS